MARSERDANSACHLFILWLLNCICLSFVLVLGAFEVDLIASVPEFTYLLCIPMHVYRENIKKPFSQNVSETNG